MWWHKRKNQICLSTKRTSPFKSARGVSSVDYWQASCTHKPAGFILLVQACVLQSCDAYWLPTPFSCFPFTSPLRHRVPSYFNWTLLLPWRLHGVRKNILAPTIIICPIVIWVNIRSLLSVKALGFRWR